MLQKGMYQKNVQFAAISMTGSSYELLVNVSASTPLHEVFV